MSTPEAWLRGPVAGVTPWLMPAAHAFVQVGEELESLLAGLDDEQLWARPGGAASVGFHLRHIAGATDRLLAYARGESLSPAQLAAAQAEAGPPAPGDTARTLLANARAALEGALSQLRATPAEALLEPREVGRQRRPSNVLGLLFHAAEHAQRHCGQAATTAKVLKGT